MRGSDQIGRFDQEYEVKSIRHGISQDLQRPAGQAVKWYVFDDEATEIDPIYDVGASDGGRSWKKPLATGGIGVLLLSRGVQTSPQTATL